MVRRLPILFTLFLAAACARKVPGVKIDPAMAMLIPRDATVLGGVHVEALQKTSIYKKYLADRQIPAADDLAKLTGIDARKDLWELVFVAGEKYSAVLGRGSFASDMEPKLERAGARIVPYKAYHLIGNDQTSIVFFSSSTAAVGTPDALRWIVDARGTGGGPPTPLAEMMKQLPEEAQIWAVESGAPALPRGLSGNLGNANKLLSSIQSGALHFDLRTGLSGVASGACATEKDAQDVGGALKALVGFARLSTPADQPELAKIYDGVRVTQEARQVKLYIDVPEPLVEKLANMIPAVK